MNILLHPKYRMSWVVPAFLFLAVFASFHLRGVSAFVYDDDGPGGSYTAPPRARDGGGGHVHSCSDPYLDREPMGQPPVQNYATQPYEVAVISDLHIGESGDTARDNLNAVVNRINEWAGDAQHNLRLVVITGDLTNTALPSQWQEVRAALDRLVVPYLPTLGNHDVWSYNGTWEESHPTGDRLFAQTFADVFVDWQQNTSGDPLLQSFEYWGDSVVHDPDQDIQCQFQNWKLQYGGIVMFGLDWNTRVAAATRLGYQGSMPTAALHDFANGTFPWIRSQLVKLNGTAPADYLPQVLLLHHHPYRTPLPIPGFVYDFGPEHKHQLEQMFRSSLVNSAYWGSIAGHFHIWQNTTAFDDWPTFRQWDTKACKVDAAISLVTVQAGRITSLSREYGTTPTVL